MLFIHDACIEDAQHCRWRCHDALGSRMVQSFGLATTEQLHHRQDTALAEEPLRTTDLRDLFLSTWDGLIETRPANCVGHIGAAERKSIIEYNFQFKSTNGRCSSGSCGFNRQEHGASVCRNGSSAVSSPGDRGASLKHPGTSTRMLDSTPESRLFSHSSWIISCWGILV